MNFGRANNGRIRVRGLAERILAFGRRLFGSKPAMAIEQVNAGLAPKREHSTISKRIDTRLQL
jgi:hypothetical protein